MSFVRDEKQKVMRIGLRAAARPGVTSGSGWV